MWLIPPMIFMPVLHKWAWLARPAIIVAHNVRSRVRLMIIFSSDSMHSNSSIVKASQWAWTFQINTSSSPPLFNYVVSSAMRSYCQVLESNQEGLAIVCTVWGSMKPRRPTNTKETTHSWPRAFMYLIIVLLLFVLCSLNFRFILCVSPSSLQLHTLY